MLCTQKGKSHTFGVEYKNDKAPIAFPVIVVVTTIPLRFLFDKVNNDADDDWQFAVFRYNQDRRFLRTMCSADASSFVEPETAGEI